MQWIGIPENVNEWFGFVYMITRTNAKEAEKRYYIGCKQFSSKRTKKALKGKTRKRIEYIESDWEDYYGSSEELKRDVIKYGKENFKREILHLVKSKWELKYSECVEQFKHNVLLDETSYNSMQNIRIGKVPKSIVESGRLNVLPRF